MYRRELDYLASSSEAALYSLEDPVYGDAAHCKAALHRPVMEPAVTEPEDPEYEDDAHCRTVVYRSVASPAKEAAETGDAAIYRQLLTDPVVSLTKEATEIAVGSSQIVKTPNVEGTSEAAPVVKEAAEETVRASKIVRAARVAETQVATPVIKEEAGNVVEAFQIV